MFITQDAIGQKVTAQIEPGDGPAYVSIEITRLTGQANAAWLTPNQALELAAVLVTRAVEAQIAESLNRASAPAARVGLADEDAENFRATRAEDRLIGTIVRRADDDAPVPRTGIITGTFIDNEGGLTCYVAWDCYSLDQASAAVPAWHDELTPAGRQ